MGNEGLLRFLEFLDGDLLFREVLQHLECLLDRQSDRLREGCQAYHHCKRVVVSVYVVFNRRVFSVPVPLSYRSGITKETDAVYSNPCFSLTMAKRRLLIIYSK